MHWILQQRCPCEAVRSLRLLLPCSSALWSPISCQICATTCPSSELNHSVTLLAWSRNNPQGYVCRGGSAPKELCCYERRGKKPAAAESVTRGVYLLYL